MVCRPSIPLAVVTLALGLGCAAAPPIPLARPAPQHRAGLVLRGRDQLVLQPTQTVSSLCVEGHARVVLRGAAELILEDDRPTIVAGGGLVVEGPAPATLTLRSHGTSDLWLFLDLTHGSITLRGDIGQRGLRIWATGPGPVDAYEIHLRDLRTGGIAMSSYPVAHTFLEEGLTFGRGTSDCGFCSLTAVPPPAPCAG